MKKNSWWTKAAVVIFTNGGKQSNFIEIVLRHGCSSVNLLHYFLHSEHLFRQTLLGDCFCIKNRELN